MGEVFDGGAAFVISSTHMFYLEMPSYVGTLAPGRVLKPSIQFSTTRCILRLHRHWQSRVRRI